MADVNTNPPILTIKDINRFWSKVDRSNGHGPKGECWKWTRGTKAGYGYFDLQKRKKTRWLAAHRISFFLANGYWPMLFVCHKCDWPLCCNPSHLFEGSQRENRRDAVAKGRQARGETIWNSKLTESQVLEIRSMWIARRRHADIAQQFGITVATVRSVVYRTHWKHV